MEDDGIIGELLPRDLGYPELRAVRRARHLRDCQGRAVAWLAGITGLGFGAVLADDMGLGKTLTIIAFHLHRSAGPALVVCPASLLTNWEREIARFAPGVPVRRHHGAARDLNSLPPDGILLTSYRTLLRDIDQFRGVCFGLVVADGAQAIKNPRGLHAAALRQLDAGLRVAVTGTPVENSLTDLWAILDFGRRQTVHVHHLIAENTVEDHIGELLRHKRAIADRLLTGDEMSLTELTDEELGQLVSLGAGGGRDQA
jgi:SNF2 family DNA or RNA helicase